MDRLLAAFILTVSSCTHAMSQGVKVENLNKKCGCKATLLDSILTELTNGSEPINKSQVQDNHVDVRERIGFLNADFNTRNFEKACEVKCADFVVENGFHFGVIDMGFQEKDKNKCLQIIRSSRRQNFKTKALTKFKIIEKRNELVIIYSETPYAPTIQNHLK